MRKKERKKEVARKSKRRGAEILITASTKRLSEEFIILVFITLLR